MTRITRIFCPSVKSVKSVVKNSLQPLPGALFSLRRAALVVAVVILLLAQGAALRAADIDVPIDKSATQIIQVSLRGFSAEVEKVLRFDLEVLGMEMQENGTADYQQFMKDDIERYASLVKRLGISTQE